MRDKISRSIRSRIRGGLPSKRYSEISPPRVCSLAALLDRSAAPPAVMQEGRVAFLHVGSSSMGVPWATSRQPRRPFGGQTPRGRSR